MDRQEGERETAGVEMLKGSLVRIFRLGILVKFRLSVLVSLYSTNLEVRLLNFTRKIRVITRYSLCDFYLNTW